MTDFKITPEDVGRIADDGLDTGLRLVLVTDYGAVFEHLESKALYTFNLRGEPTDGVEIVSHRPGLKGWRPTLLEAPKRWWVVHRNHTDGSFRVLEFTDYEAVNIFFGNQQRPELAEGSELVAVTYGHHWHGCEEGVFQKPGDEGVPEDAQ